MTMVQLKEGVVLAGNKYTNAILFACQTVYAKHEWPVVITSGRDSHVTGYHPKDRAIDVRCWMIPKVERETVATELKAELSAYYDVVYEPEETALRAGELVVIKGAHFHIEADAVKELHGSTPV